ncbi:MAG: Gfo/Idh/MocA family oxidoreductase [Candidatus Omnitrophica bacterium]|nr:Gfo/Idh/MocA family oxidoreductase [Candidatus Omnitrophota bacterium]
MDKIRVAVIGVGHLGSIHARIYKELDSCELAGVCDIDEKRLKQIATQYSVEGYGDYKKLFNNVDAVSVAVPTQFHHRVAKDFLNHNIHVLVEKPFTLNLPEAASLIKIAKAKNLILQVGHIERFNSAFTATQDIISQPQFIECHRLSAFSNRSLDIGVVLDLMIHDLDIVLGLVNAKVKKVEAVGIPVLTSHEDIANARITFDNGCVANLTASRVSDEPMRKIRIFQKHAYISLDYRQEQAHMYQKSLLGITKTSLPIEKEEPLKRELSSFLSCILQHTTPLVSGEVAYPALALALRIQKIIWKNHKPS